MSQEVAIIAVIQPAQGKVERFKEVMAEALKWIEANEPETLEFSVYEQEGEDGVKLSFFERYASQAAMDKHESSENYKKLFQILTEEELVAAPPIISKGKIWRALKR